MTDPVKPQQLSKFQMFFACLGMGVLTGVLFGTGAMGQTWVLIVWIIAILLLVLAVISLPAFMKLVSVFPAIAEGVRSMKMFRKPEGQGGNDGPKPGEGQPPTSAP